MLCRPGRDGRTTQAFREEESDETEGLFFLSNNDLKLFSIKYDGNAGCVFVRLRACCPWSLPPTRRPLCPAATMKSALGVLKHCSVLTTMSVSGQPRHVVNNCK